MLNGKIRNDFVGAGFDADAHGVQIDLCVASLEEPSHLVMELPQQIHGNRRRIDGFSVNDVVQHEFELLLSHVYL